VDRVFHVEERLRTMRDAAYEAERKADHEAAMAAMAEADAPHPEQGK
jgi:hypothetical protein